MRTIFISYRRDDSGAQAGRIYDRLADHFGRERVFMDIDGVDLGEDFIDVINRTLASAGVMIAVIGKDWLTIPGDKGRRRLSNRKDLVRVEIATALRKRIRIIPVLVAGAKMPRAKQLPRPLAALARKNALEIPDTLFHPAVERLITAIEKKAPRVTGAVPPPPAGDFAEGSEAETRTVELTGSVGRGGANAESDVKTVQRLLAGAGDSPGPIDGKCGPRTIAAIASYQSRNGLQADGLISPAGPTFRMLTAAPPAPEEDWSGDSSQWPLEKKLLSLEPDFRGKVKVVLDTLTEKGFQPRIIYGWRSVAVQRQLVAEGRSKVRFSFHNAQNPDGTPNAYAADIVDRRWLWTPPAEKNGFWRALGDAAKANDLVWGGDWTGFPDLAHIQGRPNSELAMVKVESGLA